MNNGGSSNVDPKEQRLIASAVAGDSAARWELFEGHRDVAYRVAARIIGRHDDALDAVQDAFIKAFDRLGELASGDGFRAWLLRIVANRALDMLRAKRVRRATSLDRGEDDGGAPEPASDAAAVDADIESAEATEQVQRAVDRLPPDQKAVFSMYATGELTYGEIAAALGVPIGTVMSRLFHARKKLQEMLAAHAPREVRRER